MTEPIDIRKHERRRREEHLTRVMKIVIRHQPMRGAHPEVAELVAQAKQINDVEQLSAYEESQRRQLSAEQRVTHILAEIKAQHDARQNAGLELCESCEKPEHGPAIWLNQLKCWACEKCVNRFYDDEIRCRRAEQKAAEKRLDAIRAALGDDE